MLFATGLCYAVYVHYAGVALAFSFPLCCRRSPAPISNRDPYGNASLSSSSNSGSCKGSDCSPTPRLDTHEKLDEYIQTRDEVT